MSLMLKVRPKAQKIMPASGSMLDVIVIGGGPAGLTAAIYCLRAKLKIVLIEKMILGGLASTSYLIENYPGFPDGISGTELSTRLQDQAKKLGLDISWGQAIKVDHMDNTYEVRVDSKKFQSKAVIVASGTEPAKLGVPGEEEFIGRGISFCATCDGPFYKDKHIMVVGGGNAAIEEAIFLTRYASKVSVVHRRDQLRSDKVLAERAASNPKIYFFWHSVIEKIMGDTKVTSVSLKDLQNKRSLTLPIDGIFVYIGSKPNSEIVKDLVKVNKSGYILTNPDMQTSSHGIFAAGDVRDKKLRQVVTAASDGAIAAASAIKYIENI